jgi:hypothetical protein
MAEILNTIYWGGLTVIGGSLLLMLIGFRSGGIAGGSMAANMQASLGNVGAGSLFSIATSAGMRGILTMIVVIGGIFYIIGGFAKNTYKSIFN